MDVLIGNEPYNKFTANNTLMYNAFPFLFVMRKGLPSSGSLSKKFIRHMLVQFSGRFGASRRLGFFLMDQLQRHTACRVVSSRIKAHRESMEAFGQWVQSQDFKNDLCEAAKDPFSPKAICLLKRIEPLVRTCASQIPYTVSQRKSSLRNLRSLLIFFGIPSVFLTFSPDDINGVLNIHSSIPQTTIKGFLSEDDGLLDGLVHGESHFKSIPIEKYSLRVRLASAPVAATEVFIIIAESVFDSLLKTPLHSTKKKRVL